MRKSIKIIIICASIVALFLFVIWFQVTQPLFRSARNIDTAVKVEPSRLKAHVTMLSEEFIPRDYKHPENLDRTASYIRTEFENTDGRVSEQVYTVDGVVYRNIILMLGPQTQERIVVGAHYDTAGELPGADDNASGIAGLIELARLLSRAPLLLTVELVAYTLEEPPFFRTDQMGSYIHATQLREQGIQLRIMIALEMIGYFSDDANSQHFPLAILNLLYPTEGNWLAVIGDMASGAEVRAVKTSMRAATELPVYSFNAPPSLVAGIDWSDHLNYRKNGYPGIMISDTAFLRNLNYHTEHDTPDLLDYDRMAMVVAGVYSAVLDIAREQ